MAVSRFFFLVLLLALPSLSAYAVTSPVGSTSGAFEVNNNGAATYTVPIQVPPGVNGVEPKLALVYNSQQGNGQVGVGWSFSGLQEISRCPGTIAIDGARSAISFTASRYCWNGQRLIPKTNTGGVQNTGSDADGTFWEFRTEFESFARIRAYSSLTNPTKFKVWTKDGRILSFGSTTDSVINPQNKGRLIWALNREEDRKGNYIDISYTKSSDQGEYYPTTIQYGGAGLVVRSVSLGTDTTRSDKLIRYVSGAKLDTTRRLRTITTKYGENTVRTYTLNYASEATAASRSLLQNIQECGSDGVCYTNRLTFVARSAGTSTFTDASAATLTTGTEFGQWNQLVDMNGDGLMDVFRVTSPTNGTVAVMFGQPGGGYASAVSTGGVVTNETTVGKGFSQWNEIADVNGDGIMDIFRVIIPGSGSTANANVYLGNPNGTFNTTAITLTNVVAYDARGFRYNNQLIDMDGDGLMDLFSASGQNGIIRRGSVTGSYSLLAPVTRTGILASYTTGLDEGFRTTNQLADANGDGLVDVIRKTGDQLSLRLAQSDGSFVATSAQSGVLAPSGTWGGYANYINYLNQFIDVNGDGVLDVVRLEALNPVPINPSASDYGSLIVIGSPSTTTEDIYSGPVIVARIVTTITPRYYGSRLLAGSTLKTWLGDGAGGFVAQSSSANINMGSLSLLPGGSVSPSNCSNSNLITDNVTVTVVNGVSTTTYFNSANYWGCETGSYTVSDPSFKGLSHLNQFADMDGDGYVDLIRLSAAGNLTISFGNGAGSFSSTTSTLANLSAAAGFRAWNQIADMNGDGIADLFAVSGTTGIPKISGRNQPGLMASATDGNGLLTSVSYQSLPRTSNYSRSPGSDSYPVRKVQFPLHVVTESTVAATGFSYVHSYAYSDARVDLHRGWQGFATVTRTDSSTSLQTTTTFNQNYPYIGRPTQQTIRHTGAAAGRYLSTTSYAWGNRADNSVNSAGRVRLVYPSQSVQSTYEPNNNYALVQTVTTDYLDNAVAGNYDALPYDRYGNPERVRVSYSDGHIVTTVHTNSYLTEATTPSTLHLGQLSQQETAVSHAVPAPGSETRTRVTRNTFYPADGLLQASISQPNTSDADTALRLTSAYGYDANGRISVVSATGADVTYDAGGNIASSPSISRSTSHAYVESSSGTLTDTMTITVSGAVSHSETVVYDARHGSQSSHTDPAGLVTVWGYDGFGRKTAETQYSGIRPIVTAIDFIAASDSVNCPAVTGLKYCVRAATSGGATALSPVTTQYDALGRELRVLSKDAQGNTVYQDTQYDSAGRVWRTSRPYLAGPQWTTNVYDLAGRPLTVTSPNAVTTTYNYQGLVTTVTHATSGETSQSTTTTRNSQGNITRVRDALAKDTDYVYGAFGLLKQITDAKNNSISYTYDIYGNRTGQIDPDTGNWQFRYNAFGEAKWQKDAKAQLISYQYDHRGRITSRTEGSGSSAVTSVWTYDTGPVGAGRLEKVTRSGTGIDTVTQSYLYDAAGQPRTATVSTGSTSYSATTDYDALNRPQTVTYPDSALSVKYAYYPNGALKEITDPANPSIYYWKATAYNAQGQPTNESWGNGRTGTRSYDAATGALTAIATAGVQNLSYTYYKLGNLRTRTNGLVSVTETFGYDVLNRLTSAASTASGVATQTFSYDEIGNLTFKTGVGSYTYGGPRPHAVTQTDPDASGDANASGGLSTADTALILNNILTGTVPAGNPDCNRDGAVNILDILCVNRRIEQPTHLYNYDANGNMTSGGGRSISYTAFNMPATVEYSGRRDTFTYAPDYSRLTKEVRTVSTNEVTESTVYLGKLYERTMRAGTVEERFFIAAGDRLVAQVSRSGSTTTKYYVHTDLLGSAETVTDASGTVIDSLSFDAWGQSRQANWQSGASATGFSHTTRGYTGHETDVSSGLVNMNARLYDPRLGRFLQPDAIIPDIYDPQSINPYSYVLNNPFRYTDPTGHQQVVQLDTIKVTAPDPMKEGAIPWDLVGNIGVYDYPFLSDPTFPLPNQGIPVNEVGERAGNPHSAAWGRASGIPQYGRWSEGGSQRLFYRFTDLLSTASSGSVRSLTWSESLRMDLDRLWTREAQQITTVASFAPIFGVLKIPKILGVADDLAHAAVAAKGAAGFSDDAVKLSRQLSSQEGVGELLSGGGKAIAGAGVNTPLRDVGRLVNQYGGNPGDWAKVTSTAPGHLQTHAYRNVVTGEVVELKSIVP